VEVNRAERSAAIKLAWDAGTRYRYGKVKFDGSQFREGFLQRYVPFKSGDYFSQDQLLQLQQALNGADYFSVVNVLPDVDEAKQGVVDVTVQLVPAKRTIYTGGPFIGTDTGFGVRGGIERRWVNDRGHKWKNEIVLAQRLKTLSTLYSIPMPGPNQRSFNYGANYRDADTDTSQSRTLELVGNESRLWHGWVRTLGVHALIGTFTVGKRGSEPDNAPGVEHGRSKLVFGEASLTRKRADNPDFVRRGWSLNLYARSTAGTLLSSARFNQLTADAKWIRAFTRRDRLILRGTAGATWTSDFSALPPQLRFFAGGDRSVRGYGFQTVGPKNSYGRVIGGRDLLVASATVEHYFTRNWGIAAFVDAGNAFNGTDYRPKIGTGLGLRWRSPVGLIRLDLGTPVRDKDHHGVELHIVIGPDL
jgi:translocation and assembly module TamA